MDPKRTLRHLAQHGRRAAAIASITFVIATFLAPISFGVQAGAGDLGGFENDGNLVVDAAPSIDWSSALPALTTIVDDTVDSGFQGSSKELKPSEWVCNAGGASPGKGNLLRAYLNSTVFDDTEVFLNLAWVRESASGQGDVHVNYEFNQNGTAVAAPTSGPCPIERTAGDILVTYDFDGGGSLPHINVYSWVPSAVPTSDADGDWVNGNIPASAARAAVNATTVIDPLHGNATVETLRFGEATINLTAVLAASGITDCQVFGAANIRSRSSGESWTSALQDNLPGMPINISTCPVTPDLTTTATLEVMEGNAIGDVAHLSGGNAPTGTITFRAYGPNDVDCSGTPAFVSTPVTVNGNGDYASPSFVDPAPGTYRWIASYESSDKRNLDTSGACNDPGETTTVLPETPALTLDKKVNGADHAAPADILTVYVGDPLHYTVDITNGGNVPLVISDLVDSLNIGFEADCDQGNGSILSVGAGFSCEYSTTASSFAHNVASVKGTTQLGKTVTASDGTFVNPIDPSIEISKTAADRAHHTDLVTYVFEVTNTGDVTLTDVSVDDDVLGHIGGIASLAAGASQTLSTSVTAPADDVTNVGTACGDDPLGGQVCDNDDHTLDVIHPEIQIVKTGTASAHEGDAASYSFEVTNTGDVTLTDVSVDDDVLGHIGDIASLAAGASQTLVASSVAPADDVTNVATACGDDPLDVEFCDDDDHTLDVIHPGIDILKTGTAQAHEGDAVSYSFEVTNTGDVTLTDVSVDDDVLGHIGDIASLAADASEILTKAATAPDDDVTNVGTACGVDPLDSSVCEDDDHSLDVIHPGIEIVKAGATQAHEGDGVTYSFEVSNTGDVTLTDVSVDDDVLGHIGDIASLASGASQTLTKDTTAPADDVTNVGTACGVDPLDAQLCDDDDHTLDVIHPAIRIVKTGTERAHEGDATEYSFEVTNMGDVVLKDVDVNDDVLGHIGDIASLAPGDSQTLVTSSVAPADDVTNVGTACGDDPLDAPVCDGDDHTLDVITPGIEIMKTGAAQAHEGDGVTYSFEVTNTGDVTLTDVSVDDDVLGHIGDIASLAAGASQTLTKAATAPADDVTNVGTACGDDPLAAELCDDDDHTLDVIHPSIEVVKTGTASAHEGDATAYSFEVTNTGDVTLTDVSVDDDVLGHIGDIASLAAGASQTLTKTATAPSTDVRNVGTACGTDPLTEEVCDDDDHTLDVIHPSIDVTKSGPAKAHEGDAVTYSFEVTNTGDVALAPVTVVDDVLGAIDTIASLGVGETVTLDAIYSVPESTDEVVNEVTACGLSPVAALELCDTDLHVLDVIHPAVTLDKQLAGADHATAEDALQAHEGEALGYTLLITNTGDAPLEVTAFEDSLGIDLDQACSAGVGDVLAAGDVITCTYTHQAPADDVHNVASVTGIDELGGPAGTVSASDETFADVVHPAIEVVKAGPAQIHEGDTATYTFQVTNTGDVTLTDVTVSDDVLGAIGTIDSLDAGASQTLSADFVIPAGVGDVTNVATACGVDPVALEVCDDDTHTAVVITPSIEVVKTADPLTATPGQEVTYTYEVTNTGDTPLVDLTLVDDILGDILGDIGTIDVLEPGATQTFTVTVVIAADTPRTNVATVCGSDALGLEVCDDDDATITIVLLEGPTPRLPMTGLPLMLWLAVSTALMAAGLVMIDAQQKRRQP